MADINVALRGSMISIDNVYITSGSVGTVSCNFTFDSTWDGYFKTAVFYQNPKAVKYVLLDTTLSKCIVPREALKLSRPLYIGVFGTKGLDLMTSGIASVDIAAGSYMSGSVPPEPAPDVYAQILGLVEQYRNDNAAAAAAALISENTAEQHALDAWEASGAANSAYAAIVTEESERAAAEEMRLSAESNRTAAETSRASTEAARVSTESARVSAESGRASAETARAGAESVRVTAETARVSAETNRATNYAKFSTGIAENTSSIKSLEEQLIGLNPSSESRVSVSSYASSVALPKNAAQGGLKTTIKGMTLTNILTNADFSNGTTGWNSGNATFTVVNNIGTFTATAQYGSVSQNIIAIQGHVYYISALLKSTSSSVRLVLNRAPGYDTVVVAHSGSGNYEVMSVVGTIADVVSNPRISIMDIRSSGWTAVYVKYVIVIDLTALGLTSLTKAQLNLMTDLYFGGTKHVIAPRFRSVDKNGLNPTYQYAEPKILRRTAAGVYDEISGGNFIKRVGDDGVALTTPITTENVTSGTLISYPSGTVYAEPALADAGVYGTNMSILYTGYPIKTLESIRKINFTTGEETSLDVSQAVIASGGLSFTHSGLASGDIVFFTYLYDVQRVGGENTYSYLDSHLVRQDSVTGKFYKRDWSVANGVKTETLVEVT